MKILQYIFLSFFLFACNQAAEERDNSFSSNQGDTIRLNSNQIKNADIQIGEVTKRPMSEEIHVNGKLALAPQNIVTVSFPLGGYLKENRLLPGKKLTRGETIAIIEHEDLVLLQENYLISKIELSTLSQNLDRQKELNLSKISSDKILQEAEEKFQTQKVRVKGLEEKLKLIGINPDNLNYNNISRSVALRSPITGYVSKVNYNTGRYLQPEDEIFELINPEGMHVNLTIYEQNLNKIKPGLKAEFYTGNNTEDIFTGIVKMITPNMNNDQTATVICEISNPSSGLTPGMFVTGKILTEEKEAYVISEEALVRKGDESFIIEVFSDSLFIPVPVIRGLKEGKLISVTPVRNEQIEGRKFITKNPFRVFAMLHREED